MVVGDVALEVDGVCSFIRDGPHSEHGTDFMKRDNLQRDHLQRADQTGPVVNTDDSDGAHLSVAESSGQTLAPITVSAFSLPDIGKGGPVMVDISNFTTAKILDKRPARLESSTGASWGRCGCPGPCALSADTDKSRRLCNRSSVSQATDKIARTEASETCLRL